MLPFENNRKNYIKLISIRNFVKEQEQRDIKKIPTISSYGNFMIIISRSNLIIMVGIKKLNNFNFI